MTAQTKPLLVSRLKTSSRAASAFVIFVGGLVLIGWIIQIATPKFVLPIFPAFVKTKADAALAFVLSGLSLWLLWSEHTNQRALRIAQLCAFIAGLMGLLTLLEYHFGLQLRIYHQLFEDISGTAKRNSPGPMPPPTALSFFIIGFALLLLDVEQQRGRRPAQLLTLAAAFVSFLVLIAYAYILKSLYSIGILATMPFDTALLFIVLCAGILFVRPERGFMALITSDSFGGLLTRRLLPAAIALPLVLGWLWLGSQRVGLFDSAFGLFLVIVSNVLLLANIVWATARSVHRADTERRRAFEELDKLSREDSLTGLLNRRAILDMAGHELARWRRYQRRFSMMLIDIDDFKAVNDRYGHLTGDSVLKQIADALGRSMRTADVAGRYGGDEFLVILPETGEDGAFVAGQHLVENIHNAIFRIGGLIQRVTISIGATAVKPDDENLDSLLRRADTALYEAKRQGKDRVAVSDDQSLSG